MLCRPDIHIFPYCNDRVEPPTVIGHKTAARVGCALTRVREAGGQVVFPLEKTAEAFGCHESHDRLKVIVAREKTAAE